MNFTPFNGQLSGSIPASAVHQFTAAKFAQNVTAASNGAQMGQVVGVISRGEGGVHYLQPVDTGNFQTAMAQPAQQQLITLPITIPGAKPGDPQQTVQIQVMQQPNVQQPTIQQPKYQMAQMQIPIQAFQQGELGTTLVTVAYAQAEGRDAGIQVVAALQPQDVQMLTGHMPTTSTAGNSKDSNISINNSQPIQIGTILPAQQIINLSDGDTGKLSNNNNNAVTFRVKQEVSDEGSQSESVDSQQTQQWTVAAQGAEIAEYINRLQGNQLPVSLSPFLRFNNDPNNKRDENTGTTEVVDGETVLTWEVSKVEEEDKEDNMDEDATTQNTEANEEAEATQKPKKKKKYKKKPPKPKKQKPGQVVLVTGLDGSTVFCCPVCSMVYPDKDNLEQHLVGHKIERRYICGICGAGLKRREHLERHKLGHNPERPYVCSVCLKGFKRKEHLNLHFVIHSGVKTQVCGECGKGFYRRDHLRKHARSHEMRRLREEQARQQQPQTSTTTNTTTSVQGNTIQSEITIHVPTSSMAVPIQITVPHNIVSMANSNSGSSSSSSSSQQQQVSVKTEIPDHTLQEIISQNRDFRKVFSLNNIE